MMHKIYGNRVKLFDSYMVSKTRFETELNVIRYLHPTCRLWKRSIGSLRREWAAHNLAYSLNIRRDKTESVDFEYEPRWYHKLLYGIVGTIALIIIK